ncbi:hypothetical protein SAMN02745117_02289 [Lampropedia hyalina DSM 16112]|jgi:hypothetical protein|uniref:Uncharacterized protein n=1 Tax=Lampropedia hyalina DSM 16112 TaxID=1122156 RepID=A0A1M5D1C7_9BURK|nr:hypothetical protein [Lampropedia hyalina]SHF60806.1 hypothetical protein SAMN02745117_02289 [Lampropedia hyalina DSM 16112]
MPKRSRQQQVEHGMTLCVSLTITQTGQEKHHGTLALKKWGLVPCFFQYRHKI